MELSTVQRRLVFAVIVFALAGLGVYLLDSAESGSSASPVASRPPSHHHRASPPPASPTPAGSSTSPAPGSSSAAPGQVPDIYQWLPFSKAGLASAASVTTRFGAAYGTFTYTEKTSTYIASMQSLISPDLAGQIAAAYSAPGVARLRVSRKQVSVGSADITSIRAFGPNSITFLVNVTEKVTANKDGGPNKTGYAVTVTGGGTSWQVSGIELGTVGNS
ncbi:MAG TPA: hypothetical protein VHU92_12775 [Streptosporangiaceae bacterium]|jgi:hypothetical protein|nr:hypothetical protein [Streptosporangiaceae bacterium]